MIMESVPGESVSHAIEQKYRELNMERDNQPSAEVPEIGRDSSVKVTKLNEDLDLGGSLKENSDQATDMANCNMPGPPPPV